MDKDFPSELDSDGDNDDYLFSEDDFLDEDQNYIHNSSVKRRSYVWKYFKEIPNNSKAYSCTICSANVGAQTCNLGRHLQSVHNIIPNQKPDRGNNKRGRPSRSFIWKYCTRENGKQAFCHLCKKLLYFGGGNTSNIAKHLRRIHADIVENNGEYIMDHNSPELERATAVITSSWKSEKAVDETEIEIQNNKKNRKGSSYVWKYCIKLSKQSVKCKLCNKTMSFHGTANVITHLQRRHNIAGKEIMDESELVDAKDEEFENSNFNNGQNSEVWKYYRRINKDTVRCSFCEKNLSYQGTSNLQRHLHRMHGVATSTRTPTSETNHLDLDSIWDYCTGIDDDKVKCNMCPAVFEYADNDAIYKHITISHSVCNTKKKSLTDEVDDPSFVQVFDNFNDMKSGIITVTPSNDPDNKSFNMFYDDIIEEVLPQSYNGEIEEQEKEQNQDNVEEDDLDGQTIKHLSPASSEYSLSPTNSNPTETESKRMQELKEERVRMQTEYFRQKAEYYRMQKYLTALQAKKARAELEMSNGEHCVKFGSNIG